MSIQTREINKLKDELKELWLMKSTSDNSHTTKTNRLKGQVEILKKELIDSFIGNKLGLTKEILGKKSQRQSRKFGPPLG